MGVVVLLNGVALVEVQANGGHVVSRGASAVSGHLLLEIVHMCIDVLVLWEVGEKNNGRNEMRNGKKNPHDDIKRVFSKVHSWIKSKKYQHQHQTHNAYINGGGAHGLSAEAVHVVIRHVIIRHIISIYVGIQVRIGKIVHGVTGGSLGDCGDCFVKVLIRHTCRQKERKNYMWVKEW